MKEITKEEFIARYYKIKNRIVEKYGSVIWFLGSTTLNIVAMENICKNVGFSVERKSMGHTLYSKIFKGDELIGHIEDQGLPSIELYKRKRKYAKLISKDPNIIPPIMGVHRVLGWHSVKGKNHCLAGGETVLHFNPLEITDEMMEKFITTLNLGDKIENFKDREKEIIEQLNKK